MKRTTFRGVVALLLTVDEASRFHHNTDPRTTIYPYKYGIRHADFNWERIMKSRGMWNANRYAFLLSSRELVVTLELDQTIALTDAERRKLHYALVM